MIDGIDQSKLDSIEWLITDMNDNPISLNSNVYVSFIISCYLKEWSYSSIINDHQSE